MILRDQSFRLQSMIVVATNMRGILFIRRKLILRLAAETSDDDYLKGIFTFYGIQQIY